ncbi:MAG: hypothetical protein KDK27_01455, partial [Leptospiraceae bacterium]|nr:hypothetical protein [Leptospiraceae bacterium]
MMDRKLCIPGLAGIMSLILIGSLPGLREQELMAQDGPESPETVSRSSDLSRPTDPLRECRNRDDQPEADDSDPIFYDQSWGNNPQEGQYRQEMERLLRLEIDEVKKA